MRCEVTYDSEGDRTIFVFFRDDGKSWATYIMSKFDAYQTAELVEKIVNIALDEAANETKATPQEAF